MRIDVTYADRAPRIIETAGEAMLSASTMSGAPEWRGTSLPVTAVMLRPRTDLLARGDAGLVVELCAWSSANDGWRDDATVSDFGRDTEAPRLQYHVFRVWEVLPPDDVAHAVDIEIDGRIHVRRVGGRLLDLTCYERLEEMLLSHAERSGNPFDRRVMLVHERLRRERPGITDAQAGAAYGLGSALIDYALSLGSEGDGGSHTLEDGLGDFASSYGAAESAEQEVQAVADAMLTHPGVTLEELRRALNARQMDVEGLTDAWGEAEGRLADEDSWPDLDWEDLG